MYALCYILLQLLSSLQVILTLPPLSSTSHKAIRDIHRQVANGVLELLQAHSSDLQSPSEWSIVFSVLEFAGTGLVLYEKREDIPTSTPVAMETVSMDTGVHCSVATSDSCVHSEDAGIQSDWVWVEEKWHPQIILPNLFDLLSDEKIPIHDPQVSKQHTCYLCSRFHYTTCTHASFPPYHVYMYIYTLVCVHENKHPQRSRTK